MTKSNCSYKDKNSAHDKVSMIFSLNPITENSELHLASAVSLSLVTDTVTLGLGDQFAYEFCDQISQVCATFRVIPETQTLIIDYDGFCQLTSQSSTILDTISYNLAISKDDAMEQAQNFFTDRNIIVQAGGVQGSLYTLGSYIQSAGSAGLAMRTIQLAKLAGVSGLQILKAQPMLAVAIPATGAIFFYSCGAIVGNTTFGKVLITTGDILAFPMKGVEIMWNSYANPAFQKVFGIPVILNMTQSFKVGPGYTLTEIARYIPVNKKSILKTVKEKIVSWLR
jgi:hypothetical protein